jgi:hypothetical protein
MKKKLSRNEEFEIMKLVLDKFLWLGFGIMAYGLYNTLNDNVTNGISLIIAGAIVVFLFMLLIVKEYEIIKD